MRKKIYFLSTLCLFSMSVFGQGNKSNNNQNDKDTITSIIENHEHFTFLDIPINGTIRWQWAQKRKTSRGLSGRKKRWSACNEA